MEETVPKVRGAADVTIVGLMVSLNRMEVGLGGKMSALVRLRKDMVSLQAQSLLWRMLLNTFIIRNVNARLL